MLKGLEVNILVLDNSQFFGGFRGQYFSPKQFTILEGFRGQHLVINTQFLKGLEVNILVLDNSQFLKGLEVNILVLDKSQFFGGFRGQYFNP